MWLKSRKEIREKDKEIAIMKNYGESYRSLVQSVRMRQHQFDNHLMALGGIYKTAGSVEELIRLQSLYCQGIKEENHSCRFSLFQNSYGRRKRMCGGISGKYN